MSARRNLSLESALEDAQRRFAAANPASEAQYARACEALPGGNTRSVLFYPPFPLTIARGEGARLWDADGHEYRDLLGEYTAGLYGHSHPRIREVIESTLAQGFVLGAPNCHEEELASLICARFPSCDRVRFTNSGTEGNLMALTAARAHTGRTHVMAFRGGYHGGVLLFANGASPANAPYPFVVAEYNDIESTLALVERHAHELAAILIEPMMGTGGGIPADVAFLRALREAATRHDIVLIFDEVMTSRLSPGGLQARHGVVPDMTSFGKYIGGGMTFGAFGGRAELMDLYDPRRPDALPHAGTFNNNVLTMAAGAVGLREIYTEAAAQQLNARADAFRDALNAIARRHDFPASVTGLGSILSVHFQREPIHRPADTTHTDPQARALFHIEMLSAGFYTGKLGFMSPSLLVSDADYAAFADAFEEFIVTYSALFEGQLKEERASDRGAA